MKHLFLLLLIASGTTMYAQTSADSSIKVSYAKQLKVVTPSAFYLNDQFIGNTLWGINLNSIESVNVVKEAATINGIQYNGKIFVKTKTTYVLKLITLNDLKFKYTNLTSPSVLFMIDGNIVNADYDKCLVDENNVLQIFVDDFNNPKEKLQLTVVKILTKTDDNIKKAKEVRIRGNEMTSY